jgi:hypothetical protein
MSQTFCIVIVCLNCVRGFVRTYNKTQVSYTRKLHDITSYRKANILSVSSGMLRVSCLLLPVLVIDGSLGQ